jgi:predicted dithiol-disulfide oxidoreductase (DUF899 family)
MTPTKIASRQEWLEARLALLEKEKAHSRARDELTREREALPWVKLEKTYTFAGPAGSVSLTDLFGDRSQLIVQHFMFDPQWDEGCKLCSFMADHMDPSVVHLAQRDTAFAAVSKAPLEKLIAYKKRMGWSFPWVSSADSDFNRDFDVSFTDEELAQSSCRYNYRDGVSFPAREAPGISVFARDDEGNVYHTYSVYGRGLEKVMTAYDLLDMVPKGRDEAGKNMYWVRRKDEYA